MTTYTAPLPISDDPQERLRVRLHALEMAHATNRQTLRMALPFLEASRPRHASEPLCDSDGCVRCREVRDWQKALQAVKAALGEELP